jgi:N-acylglucosamine 2-epimerase
MPGPVAPLPLDALRETYREALLENVLPFWMRHGLDHEHGGVLTCLDRDGGLYDSDKSVWFQGRFGWLLATLALELEPREDWLAGARSCVEFLQRHGFDSDGRMFFILTRDGRPVRKRRYVFSEMFAAMAFAAYAATSGDSKRALAAVDLFERACERLESPGGIEPKQITATRATAGFGGPMIVLGTGQALRASLAHLGKTAIRDSAAGGQAADWIGRSHARINARVDAAIDAIQTRFVRPELEAVLENVLADGNTFLDHADGRLVNPGHAIEGAWFMMQEGVDRGDDSLVELGMTMLRWSWKIGWDEGYGGILYFRDVLGKPVTEYWHDMKFWWPQNEAVIATLMAWSLTGDATFRDWHAKVHAWAHAHLADPEQGEWYGWARRDGTPTHTAKGSLWKGPFHLPRMQLVCWQLLARHTA